MPREMVDAWDLRLKNDLQYRMSSKDGRWEDLHKMVRNTDEGFRNGNLVTDFIRVLQIRLFSQPWNVEIVADDPDYVDRAEEAEVVASSVARIANMADCLFEAGSRASPKSPDRGGGPA